MIEPNTTDLNASSAAQPQGAPESQTALSTDPYADIALPENSALPADTLTALKQIAAEANLSCDTLQKWLSLEEARLQRIVQQETEKQHAQTAAWAQQTQEQLGPSWQEEVSRAVRAADRFGGPELRQLLEETGLGNHPVIVRTFTEIGKRMSEDVAPGGTAGGQTDKTFTQALYGKN